MEKNFNIEELRALAQKIFKNDGKFPIISILEGQEFIFSDYSKLDDLEKSVALKIVCQGKYQENKIAYMQIFEDLSAGLALTIDSLCIGGSIGNKIFKYNDIVELGGYSSEFEIYVDYEKYKEIIEKERHLRRGWCNQGMYGNTWHYDFGGISRKTEFNEGIRKFIDVVKNF